MDRKLEIPLIPVLFTPIQLLKLAELVMHDVQAHEFDYARFSPPFQSLYQHEIDEARETRAHLYRLLMDAYRQEEAKLTR